MNQFQKNPTTMSGVFLIDRFIHEDLRGTFTKTFNKKMFSELMLCPNIEIYESLCSISQKDVLRGMHYQRSPFGSAKIISVVKGAILDVIVNIDINDSDNKPGQIFSAELSDVNGLSLFVPEGCAHGFLVLSDYAVVVYHQTNIFDEKSDAGIHYNSFGFDWPVKNPILSEKDRHLPEYSSII